MESNEFIATKDQLKNIRAFVKSLLNEKDFSKDEIEKIILAVGEASMNIVQHAYKGGNEDKKIKVEIEINEKKLFVLKDFTNSKKFNKTKDTINLLNSLKLNKHSLLILDGADKKSIQTTSNIPNISSLSSDLINAPAIARSEYIIITEKGLNNLIEKRLNKKLNIKISKTKQTKSEKGIDA